MMLTQGFQQDGGPRSEFHNVDTRPIHQLNEVLPPSRLRHRLKGFDKGNEQQPEPSSSTAGSLPLLGRHGHPPREPAAHPTGSSMMSSSYSPVAEARSALASEKPGLLQRMDQCVIHCRNDRENRTYRLNSLGVFDVKANEIRAKSMFRRMVYQELSATSLRGPQRAKETKIERQADNVNARLERMFVRVLKSIHEPRRTRPLDLSVGGAPSLAAGNIDQTTMRRNGAARDGIGVSTCGVHSMHHHSRASISGVSRPGSRAATAPRHSVTTGGVLFPLSPHTPKSPGMNGMSRSAQELDVNIPPEVTEQHLARYHAFVSAGQAKVLASAGLPEEPSLQHPDKLAAYLQTQEVAVHSPPAGTLERDKHAPSLVHDAQSIPDMIKAAVEHVTRMSEDLDELRMSMPHRKAAENKRRKPSVPLNARKHQTEAQLCSTAPSGTDDADGQLWPVLLAKDGLADLLRSSSMDDISQDAQDNHTQQEGGVESAQCTKKAVALPLLVLPEDGEPAGRSLPSINHTPITAKKLSNFLEALAATVEDVQAGRYRLDSLPVLEFSGNASKHVQARLERVWDVLQLPLASRLDTVLVFTDRERAGEFETALELWEQCAAGVLHREELLGQLSAAQQAILERRVRQVSVKELERQLIELHKVTHLILQASSHIRDRYGIELTFGGDPYPGPSVVGEQDMVQLLHWLRDDATHLYIMA